MTDTQKPLTALNDYKRLGNSGLRVSPLCLGGMSFGEGWSRRLGPITYEEAEKIFNKYCDLGGNFIDTANGYQDGDSERWLGEFMKKRGNRNQLVVATKYSSASRDEQHPLPPSIVTAGNSRKSMHLHVDACLQRLQTTYLDIFYLHFWDYTTPVEEIMRAFDDLVKSGKVHYIAVSDTPAWIVTKMNDYAKYHGLTQFILYQGRYNIGDRDLENDVIPMCIDMGLGVAPWGVLGQGKYVGRYTRENQVGGRELKMSDKDFEIQDKVLEISKKLNKTAGQVILNWTLQKEGITSPIIGWRKYEQFEDSVGALTFTLSKELINELESVATFKPVFPINMIGRNE